MAGRWMRSPGARRSAIIVTTAFAVLAAVFVSVSAFTLSPDQQAEQTFGHYQQRTYSEVSIGDMAPGTLARAAAALRSEVPGGAHVLVETDQLRPDSFAKLYVQAPITTVRFVEDPGLRDAFPGRYTLESGAWPESPNDVVVSRHLLDALPDRAAGFTTLSGRVRLHVVGVVTDAFAKHSDTIVAGPRTWESVVPPPAGHQFQPVAAQVNVLSGSDARGADIARVLGKVLPPLPKVAGERAEYLTANTSTRAQIVKVAAAKFGTDQIVVSYLPLFLVVLLVSALVVGQTRRAHQANGDRLVSIGVHRRLVDVCQATALCIVCAGSIAAGLGLGWLMGIALRAWVLPRVANQPLSPLPGIDKPTLIIAALSLVLITVGTLWPTHAHPGTRWSTVTSVLPALRLGLIRRVLVVALVVAALRAGGGPTSVFASYLMVAAVLLVAPDLLRATVWALPTRSPRTFVTRRLMRVDLGRQAAAVVVIGCCLAIPICTATQLASRKVSDASYEFSKVPAHQVWLQTSDYATDVSALARIVSQEPDVGRPVVVKGLIRPAGSDGQPGASARFSSKPRTGSFNSSVLVIDAAQAPGRCGTSRRSGAGARRGRRGGLQWSPR